MSKVVRKLNRFSQKFSFIKITLFLTQKQWHIHTHTQNKRQSQRYIHFSVCMCVDYPIQFNLIRNKNKSAQKKICRTKNLIIITRNVGKKVISVLNCLEFILFDLTQFNLEIEGLYSFFVALLFVGSQENIFFFFFFVGYFM